MLNRYYWSSNNLNTTLQGKDQLITYMIQSEILYKLTLFKIHLHTNGSTYCSTCDVLKSQSKCLSFLQYCDKIEDIKEI